VQIDPVGKEISRQIKWLAENVFGQPLNGEGLRANPIKSHSKIKKGESSLSPFLSTTLRP
jgi:hypothetical protein